MIRTFPEMVQGSGEWLRARCGLLTASEMKLIVSPKTLKLASNDKERSHLWELLSQRLTDFVEPQYISDAMLRGQEDEVDAKIVYAKHYEPLQDCGFITNDKFGFTIGYSPDGLVGDVGQVECKSRCQKYQVQTIAENVIPGTCPEEFTVQIQTGLLVSERQWCDLVSYSNGLPMATIRILPDPVVQEAILTAATAFESRLQAQLDRFREAMASGARLIPTKRKIYEEITI